MRRLIAVLAVFLFAAVAGAQPPGVYDDFNGEWIDAARWRVGYEACWGNCLETVREIERAKLRLAVRSVARLADDGGGAYSRSALPFPYSIAGSITSIQAVVHVKDYTGVACPSEPFDRTHTQVSLGGTFFSKTGSGVWADDIQASVMVWADTTAPTTMDVGMWWGSADGQVGIWTYMGTHPFGTPLVLKLTWDQAGHRFIGSAKTLDPQDAGVEVSSDHEPFPVAGPPVDPVKFLDAMTAAMNCSAVQSTSHVEARFDTVVIGQ